MLHQSRWSLHRALATGAVVMAAILAPVGPLAAAQVTPTPTPTPTASANSSDSQRGLSPGFGNVGSLNPGFGNVGSLSPGFGNVGSIAGATNAALAQLRPPSSTWLADGEATLLRTADSTTITVNLSGLTPGAVYLGRLLANGCDGPLLFNLESISSDTDGRGRASSAVPDPIDSPTWWIAYGLDGDSANQMTLCGPVQPDR